MTNNQPNFIPFTSSAPEEKSFKSHQETTTETSDSLDFVEGTSGSKPFTSGHSVDEIERLLSDSPAEIPEPTQEPAMQFADDEFDKILSRVTGDEVPDVGLSTDMPLPSLSDLGIDDDDAEGDVTDSAEISEEEREAIFAEGFMAGSIEQKEILDQRAAELRETVTSLQSIEGNPINLSDEINTSVGAFANSLMESIFGEIRDKHLVTLVESKVEEFVNHVKGWDTQIIIHCSEQDFANLCEIYETTPANGSIEVHKYTYTVDKEASVGKFRLELCKTDKPSIEAVMDVDTHLESIRESVSELL